MSKSDFGFYGRMTPAGEELLGQTKQVKKQEPSPTSKTEPSEPRRRDGTWSDWGFFFRQRPDAE